MTRESYNKHKEVIEWFYSQPEGTKVLYRACDDTTWYSTELPGWAIDYIYVINDDYSTFRKALADGKTIEERYLSPTDHWGEHLSGFNVYPCMLRIKPKPTFKVGDFVRTVDGSVIKITETNLVYGTEHFTKWEPTIGEWIWGIPSLGETPNLVKFSKLIDGHAVCNTELPGGTWATVMYTNYEPYIGELPSYCKDRHD